MPITPDGFESKRYSEIVSEINSDQKTNIAADIDTTPDSLLGVLTSIFAAAISDQEELLQAVADSFNVDKAEGKYLDDLVALVGLTRLSASPTTGRLVATGDELTVIPLNNQFSDGTNTFQSISQVIMTENQCVQAVYGLPSVTVGDTYSIKVNTTTYSHIALAGQTTSDVMSTLADLINADVNNLFAEATFDSDSNLITIDSKQTLVPMLILTGGTFSTVSISSIVPIENIVDGFVEVGADQVTTIVDAVVGLTSVTNPIPLNTGRLDETDEELRARHATNIRSAGTATIPAITASLLEVEGVTDVDLIENSTTVTDSEGRPAKSYECIVTGGSATDIAQTIFDTKPAGVQTYGDFLNIVTYEGFNYSVYFSRPVPLYIWAKIEYTLYDEEDFPLNGEQGMIDAFVAQGETLSNGQDVIPKRFYKNIYNTISGISDLTIKVVATDSPNLTPSDIDYQEIAIPVAAKQLADFDASRVSVSIV